jgi:hypothetical protein
MAFSPQDWGAGGRTPGEWPPCERMTTGEGRHTLFLSHTPTREEGTVLTATRVGYERVCGWVKPVLGATHATTIVVVAWAVLSLLVAQQVTPAALGRICKLIATGGWPRG